MHTGYGTGIGSSGSPDGIDAQFCGAGFPAMRSWIQLIASSNQIPTLYYGGDVNPFPICHAAEGD